MLSNSFIEHVDRCSNLFWRVRHKSEDTLTFHSLFADAKGVYAMPEFKDLNYYLNRHWFACLGYPITDMELIVLDGFVLEEDPMELLNNEVIIAPYKVVAIMSITERIQKQVCIIEERDSCWCPNCYTREEELGWAAMPDEPTYWVDERMELSLI